MILFEKLTKHLTTHPRKVFLIDGIGAAISAVFLGILLISFQEYIGMPECILIFLSFIAAIFAVYSFSCFLFIKQKSPLFLRIIACSNLIYCLLTGGMVVYFQDQLTPLGFCYFLAEIGLILGLVFLEFKVLKQYLSRKSG